MASSNPKWNFNLSSFKADGTKKRFGAFDTTSDWLVEGRSAKLRDWYRRGQRLFRACLPSNRGLMLNEHMQGLKGVEREGFMMGWQSDAYAKEHGLSFSVEGNSHIIGEISETRL